MRLSSFLFLLIFNFLFSPAGAQVPVKEGWRHTVKLSLNSINKANSLKVDRDGNVYVLGTTWFADSAKDILLIKYTPDGNEVWERTYDNPSHGDDIPISMCLDPEGNVWVCGMAKVKRDNADFLIVKFTPDGIPIADELYDGKDHLFDCAITIASDKQGNIYAGGYETALDSGINMLLVKYRNDGTVVWRRTYATRQMDIANSLVVDDSLNVYICGTSNNGPHTSDILIQKYDAEGKKKWQIIYDGVLSQNDVGQFITTDDSMNLYVSGFLNHANNRADIPVLKLNRNGQMLQEIFYNGRIADCGAININATRHSIYLVGGCDDYNISSIFSFAVRYDKSGKEKYTVQSPADVQLMSFTEVHGRSMLFGAATTHPESTLIPFIAANDSSKISWSYSDSTVYGLAHITDIELKGDDVYFLGDDTGDATGTISIFKYTLLAPADKKEDQDNKQRIPPKKRK